MLLQRHLQPLGDLPASLTRAEECVLLNDYLDSDAANPNFVELVSLARITNNGMVDAKTKLKAQRQHEQWTKEFFERYGAEEFYALVATTDPQAARQSTDLFEGLS